MVTLAICDDDPIHLKYTASLVQKELLSSELSLALYSAPKGLLASIREGSYCPDIVILDIELGQENGIQVAREINIALPSCSIIFLTGHPNYAPACYETSTALPEKHRSSARTPYIRYPADRPTFFPRIKPPPPISSAVIRAIG